MKRAAILKGEVGIGGPKMKDPLFDDAARELTASADTNRKPRTARDYREIVERLKAVFGASSTAAAMTCEVSEGPTPRMKPLKENPGRLRFLDEDEEAALLETAREPLRTIILVGIHTGLRIKSEALALQVGDVDLARGLVTVPAAYAKNGRSRTVPLNSTVRAALAKRLEEPVFARRGGQPYRSIRKSFELACEAAGLKDVTPHTLRHTFGSRLAMAGVNPRTIQDLGGWRSLAMVERYTHLSPTRKAAAVERIAFPEFPNAIPAPPRPVAVRAVQVR